jgi:hypothetical protein
MPDEGWKADGLDLVDLAHVYSNLARGLRLLSTLAPVPEQTPSPEFLARLVEAERIRAGADSLWERVLTTHGVTP